MPITSEGKCKINAEICRCLFHVPKLSWIWNESVYTCISFRLTAVIVLDGAVISDLFALSDPKIQDGYRKSNHTKPDMSVPNVKLVALKPFDFLSWKQIWPLWLTIKVKTTKSIGIFRSLWESHLLSLKLIPVNLSRYYMETVSSDGQMDRAIT